MNTPAGLQIERIDAINSPRVRALHIGVRYRGRVFTVPIRLDEHATLQKLETLIHEAARDLQWYADSFYFYGCGGPNHALDGDPHDVKAMTCLKCGAIKREGLDWLASLGMVA